MSTMSQLGEFLANIQNQQDARTAALEARLAVLENKKECGCGSYAELLASYEQRISALEGNTGGGTGGEGEGGSTEGEGGSTEGEGGEEGGSTEPIPASQALEEYDFLIGFAQSIADRSRYFMTFISTKDHKYVTSNYAENINKISSNMSAAYLLDVNEGDIVKVYTPDLQEIEIIADSIYPYYLVKHITNGLFPIVFGNKVTMEVYCYDIDCVNKTVSPCTDEAFIAQWGNSDALGL